MGSRVPVDVEHYDLSSAAAAAAANSYIGTSMHDLNSGDEAADPAADDVTDDNDDRSSAVVSVSTELVVLYLVVVLCSCA